VQVTITRYYYSATQTRGVLSVREDGGTEVYRCKTLELPWRGNENRESCIPPGPEGGPKTYTLRHRGAAESGKFNYPHFIVKGVDGRSYILIHRGNYYFQVLGCILPGQSFVDLNEDGHPDVTSSTETLRELRNAIPDGAPLEVQSSQELASELGPVPAAEPDPLDLPDLNVPDEIDPLCT
jgi:hypothetical protein